MRKVLMILAFAAITTLAVSSCSVDSVEPTQDMPEQAYDPDEPDPLCGDPNGCDDEGRATGN